MIYPETVLARLGSQRNRIPEHVDASGADVKLDCGCFVRFFLRLENETICDAAFQTNGCGFMVASADIVAGQLKDTHLSELHGLASADIQSRVRSLLADLPDERVACLEACARGIRAAFADLRAKRVEEFTGEKALVCTCFGVTEERIVALAEGSTLESIGSQTNAGTGCGSCLPVIEDIIATHRVL